MGNSGTWFRHKSLAQKRTLINFKPTNVNLPAVASIGISCLRTMIIHYIAY